MKIENNSWTPVFTDDLNPYDMICQEASSDDSIFEIFKKDSRYTSILEHVSYEQGKEYLEEISIYDVDEKMIKRFKENDILGSASVQQYDNPWGMISPSTLRYISNALEIQDFYGDDSLSKIVEIGGGYGGLCKTISCICDFDEYHLFDLKFASKLQEKYLSHFDIFERVIFHDDPEIIVEDIDLLVSNYAYSELSEPMQEIYYDNLIVNSKKVFMILNKGQVDREVFIEKAKNDFDVSINKVLDFWPPNGHLYYTVMEKSTK